MIEAAKSSGDYQEAIRAAKQTFPLMPAVVTQMKKEFGAFDIATSHAIHTASVLMAVMEDQEAVRQLRETLMKTSELHKWVEIADSTEIDLSLVTSILAAIANNPGVKQNELRKFVSGDGRRISTLVSWLDKGGRVYRVSKPPTYCLFTQKSAQEEQVISESNTKTTGAIVSLLPLPSRSRRPATHAAKLDLGRLPYLRLPKAPPSWEEKTRQAEAAKRGLSGFGTDGDLKAKEKFAVFGSGWKLLSELKLNEQERPNPAYKSMSPTSGSTVWLDNKGRREDFPDARTIIKTTAADGRQIAEQGLSLDVYRSDVNTDGSAMLFMSADGILHAYDDKLQATFIERVAALPEYEAQAQRFGISDTQLKNHTRCVSISADCRMFLVTIVDEAWCYEIGTSKPLWGVRFPSKEGWNEVVSERSQRSGVNSEIQEALSLMDLKLPVGPEEIARQYKTLAKQWHPDKNQGRPEFTRKFQELNSSMELLTGMDLSVLTQTQIESATHEQLLHKIVIPMEGGQSVTLTIFLGMGGSFGTDWIYAANFAYEGASSFLAGYSGRVVEISPQGRPVRVYDVGSIPLQINQTPTGLYILTPTRLYVLQGDRLQALVDVFDQGRLVVTHKGFGLLQSKQFRWYTPDGVEVGSVQTKDPIRRVFHAGHALTVETRTHRALIEGIGAWW